MKNKFYITTPIYYVNSVPHLGHAYTTIAADVLARYHRLIGDKTFFSTGTDEHGAKIEEKANETGQEPQIFVDEVAGKFQTTWENLNISHDAFVRTTDDYHIIAVQNALQKLYDQGDIYLGKYEGLYCRGCEQFKNEKDLVDGLCPDHKKAPEKISEESYMFKMSKYQDQLLSLIAADKMKICPLERKNEIVQFYKQEGLNDISFSRKNVKWGIPLPWDKEHTAYVWSDAFLNYLSVLSWDGEKSPNDFWPVNIQLMSKDILRVHATIWPAMLLALNLPLPEQLFVHGFFTIDGEKMSKSLGNVIDPNDLVTEYGVDGARYLIISQFPFGHDGDIKKQDLLTKYNADLANGIGNLVSRVLGMNEKYFNNLAPDAKYNAEFDLNNFWVIYRQNFQEIKIFENLTLIQNLIKWCDGYIDAQKPWELAKNNDKKLPIVIYNLLEIIRQLSFSLVPFLPETAEKIWDKFNLKVSLNKIDLNKVLSTPIEKGQLLNKGEALFQRK